MKELQVELATMRRELDELRCEVTILTKKKRERERLREREKER